MALRALIQRPFESELVHAPLVIKEKEKLYVDVERVRERTNGE